MFLIHVLPLLTSLRRARDRLLARVHRLPGTGEAGQATTEYALMLLGVVVIAVALLTWATTSGRIGDLFDAVFDEIESRM